MGLKTHCSLHLPKQYSENENATEACYIYRWRCNRFPNKNSVNSSKEDGTFVK